jgi:uncharacterized protein YqeY
MKLKAQFQTDLVAAMKSGDTVKRDAIRSLLAAIKQIEKDDQVELDDAGVEAVLQKQVKQRQETIDDAVRAGRPELEASEKADMAILQSYLPEMMSEDEIRAVAMNIIEELGASGRQDMGRVMGKMMPELKGRADGRLVSAVVSEELAS